VPRLSSEDSDNQRKRKRRSNHNSPLGKRQRLIDEIQGGNGSIDAFQASHPSSGVIDPWNDIVRTYKAASITDDQRSPTSAAVAANNLAILFFPPTITATTSASNAAVTVSNISLL
jgi:hypothetical protein